MLTNVAQPGNLWPMDYQHNQSYARLSGAVWKIKKEALNFKLKRGNKKYFFRLKEV